MPTSEKRSEQEPAPSQQPTLSTQGLCHHPHTASHRGASPGDWPVAGGRQMLSSWPCAPTGSPPRPRMRKAGAALLPHVHSAQGRAWSNNPLCKLARACCEDPRGTEGPLTGVRVGREVKLGKIQLGGAGESPGTLLPSPAHVHHCALSPARLTSAHVISTDRSLRRERLHVLGLE